MQHCSASGGLQGREKVNETKVTLLEEIYALKWDLPPLLDVQRLTITNDNYKCSKPTVSDCISDCVASLQIDDGGIFLSESEVYDPRAPVVLSIQVISFHSHLTSRRSGRSISV